MSGGFAGYVKAEEVVLSLGKYGVGGEDNVGRVVPSATSPGTPTCCHGQLDVPINFSGPEAVQMYGHTLFPDSCEGLWGGMSLDLGGSVEQTVGGLLPILLRPE